MIDFPKFSEVEWFVTQMKKFCVHQNTSPKNYESAYNKSNKRKIMIGLINNAIPGYFPTNGTDILAELIKCSYEQLLEIKSIIDSSNYDFSLNSDWKKFEEAYNYFVNNGYNIEFVRKYGIKCCPYCNENYVFSRITKSGCQLDHFFPKKKYPIFAICLYNLIPVCSICNHVKLENPINISPHDHREITTRFRQKTHLSYEITEFSWPYKEESIEIVLQYDDHVDNDFRISIENDFKTLELLEDYQYHKDYILEIIRKATLYNHSSIELIQNSFIGLFEDKDEILRYLFGNYYQQGDLLKRPLSKLTRDILLELDLIEKE